MPVMIIVFGNMTDTFISSDKFDTFWKLYGSNITAITNLTRPDFVGDPDKVRCADSCHDIMVSSISG